MAMVKGDNPLTGPFAIAGAGTGRHAGRQVSRSHRRFQSRRRRARARVRRAEHDELHADAQREPAGEDLVLRHRFARERGDVSRARLGVYREDPAAAVSRVHRRGARRRRSAQLGRSRGVRRQHGRVRRRVPGTRCICRSTRRARCCISATDTRRRATAKWPARRSKCRLRVRLQVDLIKRKKIGWPRFENDASLMAVGAYRPWTMRCGSRSRSWSAGFTPTTACRRWTRTSCCRRWREIHLVGDGRSQLRGHRGDRQALPAGEALMQLDEAQRLAARLRDELCTRHHRPAGCRPGNSHGLLRAADTSCCAACPASRRRC